MTTESVLTKSQKKHFGPKLIQFHGKAASMTVEVRYDDSCGNGHNSFGITADVYEVGRPRSSGWMSGGCLHEDIAKHFPELAHLIRWHLFDTDGPMHYIANTVFLAGDRDCWKRAKGEPSAFSHAVYFGKNPIKHKLSASFSKFLQDCAPALNASGPRYDFEVIRYDHASDGHTYSPKFTFGGYASKWHECPFDTEQEALDFLSALKFYEPHFVTVATAFSEGKERELDKARAAAAWPDATDEDLTAPGLEDRLRARLAGLLAEFRRDVEALGFTY